MTCPDTDRLLEVVLGESVDPAIQAHLRECRECGSISTLVREMRAMYRPAFHVSEESVERSVKLLTQLSEGSAEGPRSTLWDAAASGTLALVTALLTILATGSFVGGELWGPGVLGVIAVVAGAGYERRRGHRLAGA